MYTKYDVLIAADVLEHLPDPWQTLRNLHRVLAPDGRIIASVPNVRYWKVIAHLLFRGEFRCADAGVLDTSTLLHTKQSPRSLHRKRLHGQVPCPETNLP